MDAITPECLNCGTVIESKPVASTIDRRGTFAIETVWRTCTCGSFCRSRRIVRTEKDGFQAAG